jgi:hypothetical protein
MKVTGPGASGAVGGPSGARRSAGGFSPIAPGEAQGAAAAAPAAATAMVGSLDALMALQGAPDPTERRRRAVRRAGGLLDILDQVKLALLDGVPPGPALQRLSAAVREAREGTGDPRLEALLDEIETRAAVELAREEVARAAA